MSKVPSADLPAKEPSTQDPAEESGAVPDSDLKPGSPDVAASSAENLELPREDFVLVVEDSKPNADILQLHIKNQQLHVEVCEDGLEAKTRIEATSPEGRAFIKAIFSDIMMPRMDGIELLAYVRSLPELSSVPFVLVSAASERDLILQAAKHKPDGYLLKPITQKKLIEKLTAVLPKKES